MNEQIIGVLPFISFAEEVIRLDGFLIFSESKIHEITELSENVQKMLNEFSQNQRTFIQNTYGNRENKVTFLLPIGINTTQQKIELFLDILLFYMHKGGKLSQLLSTPNIFCREDFRLFILTILDSDNANDSQFLAKKKFKFHIVEKTSHHIILPIGCENIVTQNQQYGYIYNNLQIDHQDQLFQYLIQSLNNSEKHNLLRSISFYNKALSCDIKDQERFVWLSSSLESFFQIGRQNDKAQVIKQGVEDVLRTKVFKLINTDDAITSMIELITLVYDYRSSYIHGGEKLTEHGSIETKLLQKVGKLNFIEALMNFISLLLIHDVIPDNRIEGILHLLFYNQECFECVVRIYKHSADKAIKKLEVLENILIIHRFLFAADLQTISFDKRIVEKCLDNILHIFGKFAHVYQGQSLAIEIQEQIENVSVTDTEKFLKWNEFIKRLDISTAPEPIYNSILVFQQLFRLLQYEFALY
ncbi:MAG: hypothetical protein AABZ00_14595 [Chloroflexota bacterium]